MTRSSAPRRGPIDLAQQPVDRVEERLRDVGREDIADRVLWAVRGPRPQGRRSKRRQIIVAKSVGQWLEKSQPPVGAATSRRIDHPVAVTGRDQGQVVDGRKLMAGWPARPGPLRHPPVQWPVRCR